jgi:hypothetical protein
MRCPLIPLCNLCKAPLFLLGHSHRRTAPRSLIPGRFRATHQFLNEPSVRAHTFPSILGRRVERMPDPVQIFRVHLLPRRTRRRYLHTRHVLGDRSLGGGNAPRLETFAESSTATEMEERSGDDDEHMGVEVHPSPSTETVLEVEENEGGSNVVEVDLNHDPPDDVVDPLAEVWVRILWQCVGRRRGSGSRREEIRADIVSELTAERSQETSADKGD